MVNTISLESLRKRLRNVPYPGFSNDIVSQGFVRDISVEDGVVTVSFAPNTRACDKVVAMTKNIREELSRVDGVREVHVRRVLPFEPDTVPSNGGTITPLQPGPSQDGIAPRPDAPRSDMKRIDLAPEAGYGEHGPERIPSPEQEIPQDRYEGWPPVYQWEMDPSDGSLRSGESHVVLGAWEYDVWWQTHPSGLVYASLQALRDDSVTSGSERLHPVGRNVVVNLVYDVRRTGVVAIYGTARDFRPFIDAFRLGFGIEERPEEKSS